MDQRAVDQIAVGAVIVAYRPPSSLRELVREVSSGVDRALVVENGPSTGPDVLANLDDLANVDLLRWPENLGLAAGLNAGVGWARRQGLDALVTLDQDTPATARNLQRLTHHFVEALESRGSAGLGALGPGTLSGWRYPQAKELPGTLLQVVPDLLQSMTIFPVSVFDRVGLFDESLFIDSVDTEMCLRLRANGLPVCVHPEMEVSHAPGQPSRVRLGPLRATATNHSPIRRYYITRNRLKVMGQYALREPGWARHHAKHLLLQTVLAVTCETHRTQKARAICAGILDAMRGRSGMAPHWLRELDEN